MPVCSEVSQLLFWAGVHYISAVPSPELVDRIRDLYHKRVPDVRFLIPVLNGLSKVTSNSKNVAYHLLLLYYASVWLFF